MFVKILLKVAYGSFVWGVVHGWPIIFVEIVRGRMCMFVSYLEISMGEVFPALASLSACSLPSIFIWALTLYMERGCVRFWSI
jgi:hypothetical protein